MTPARRHDLLALAILTSLITLLFIDVLSGVNQLYDRDLLRYSYPGKKVLREVVLSGEFPYWNRAISGGQPMAANPAHEVFYPLTWLILVPSYDYGFQLFIAIHIYLAAWSMYALLRSLSISPTASFFGALSFALGGIVLSYLTLLPFLAAVVWMPLTLLFARRFLLHGSRRDFALAVVFFAMQLLVGEPTTILQTGILLGMYAVHRGAKQGGARGALRGVGKVALISVAALFLGAVAVLPMIDHASDSVRARGLPFADVTDWSMPPARLGELLHANLFGHSRLDEMRLYWGRVLYKRRFPFFASIYPGLLVTAFAAAGAFARVRGTALFLTILASSVLLAVGANTPLWQLLYDAGLARSIRYPEKFMLMGVFAMIVFAARALDLVLHGDERLRRVTVRVAAVVTFLASGGAAIALTQLHPKLFAAIWSPPAALAVPMIAAARSGWILTAARGVLLLVLVRAVGRGRRPVWLALAGTFVLLDLGLLLPELAPRVSPDFLGEPPPILRNLPPNRGDFRLFHHAAWHRSKREVLPFYRPHPDLRWVDRNAAMPMIPIAHGVQLAIDADYDYTALLPTTDFMKAVTTDLPAVRRDWVDVAASMSNVWYRAVYLDPRTALARAGGDVRAMQPVGILRLERSPRYFFAEHLQTVRDRFEFVKKLAPGRSAQGTAFIDAPAFRPAAGIVRHVRETANTARIEIETAGRSFLVMSVTPHKYWTVTIDGAEAEAVVTNIGYQGVIVPAAGRHVVEMRYHNPLIAAGAAISIAALLALAWLGRRGQGRERKRAPLSSPA